ncbi:MAG TPA: DUF3990 domain-containing protein [Pseudomonas oleovorans]|nr:DUF3990 domain-containing protein [Pseudomonas oleovorans]
MSNFDKTPTYHGTSDSSANDLLEGRIDISKGGGELGQGFYLGTALHVAKAWAKQMHDCETVIEFQIDDNDFWNFDIQSLNEIEVIEHRSTIRARGETRSFKFNKDIVWGPIVGGPKVYSDQHKWESPNGERFLNSSSVLRVKR